MSDITQHAMTISKEDYRRGAYSDSLNADLPAIEPQCIWLSGLSGAGKSTIADVVNSNLFGLGYKSVVLDGDHLRSGLCHDLRFSAEDRFENIRRVAHVAKLFVDTGHIVFAAFITPSHTQQRLVTDVLGNEVSLVHVSTPIHVCEQRDVKGLYKKARAGDLQNFTGTSNTSSYDIPLSPSLVLDTSVASLDECYDAILDLLISK